MRRVARYAPFLLFATYLTLSLFQSEPTPLVDLVLYNAVIFALVISVICAPKFNDITEITFIIIALLLWGLSSTVSSSQEFLSFTSYFPQIGYTLFYPFMLIAIPRIALKKSQLSFLEIIDSAIVGLGITALLASVILVRIVPSTWSATTYFSIFNSVGDLLLVALTLSVITRVVWSHRSLLLGSGIVIYCITDLLFFWQNFRGTYQFGQINDGGWLLGLSLITLALWFPPMQGESRELLGPTLISLSVFGASLLLALIALKPTILPSFTLIPALATLFMAFVRMSLALRHAKALGDEKVLARTDELTGLANRRRLISELPHFSHQEGALLLMDLDGFKPVNDTYGHDVGDKVLRHVAQRFHRALPQGALLARLGGDEFGALIPGGQDSSFETALALRATLSYPFTVEGHTISIGVSIGYVATDGSETLLQRADAAMYEAKRSGSGISSAKSLL